MMTGNGGSAPATLGFNAVAPEWRSRNGAAEAAPAIPAAESTLGSHPCVALSSAQVLPEWSNRNLADNAFSANGDYPLNFVSHSRGSLQTASAVQYASYTRDSVTNLDYAQHRYDSSQIDRFTTVMARTSRTKMSES
jgi:hypothetical protein